jgi:integrase
MARVIGKLKALDVTRAKQPGHYGDGGGLYLLIGPTGAKSWVYRFRERGRLREMGLGPVHTISLAQARERARLCREQRLDGLDPIEARKAVRAQTRLDLARAMTFRQCAEAYIAAHQAGWTNPKHAAQWPATLGAYVYPILGAVPVQAVDVGLVMKALEPIWTKKAETASRVRGRIESVLDWATTRGYRTGENPARWKGHLENLLPKKAKVRQVEHHAALPYAELPAFIAELRRQEGIGARALEFAILTASRTGEVLGARWSEIDLERRLWVIPARRMKAGREHRVPLSEPALSILAAVGEVRESDLVFPGGRDRQPLSNRAMLAVLQRMGRVETVHGFRSTFSDWCTEQTNFPSEARELALAHSVGTAVERAYRRTDLFEKRRQLAAAWARFCATQTDNVVPLPPRQEAAG